jgi:16S rRNA processing protein RimM
LARRSGSASRERRALARTAAASEPARAVRDSYDPQTLPIGVLGRPHGVHGELILRPHDLSGRALDGARQLMLVRGGNTMSYEVATLRPIAGGYLVRLVGIDDRDAASALTLAEVRMPRAALPPLGPGEYYVEDVVGCAVEDEAGRARGRVRGTFWNGAHDVATVVGDDGSERFVALVPDSVVAVDTVGRRLQVRWDEGDVD